MIKKQLLHSLFTEDAIEHYYAFEKNNCDKQNCLEEEPKGTSRNFSGEVGMLVVAVDKEYVLHEFCTSYKTNTYGIVKNSLRQSHLHSHNYYELTLVVNGFVHVQIENTKIKYTAGDFYLSDRKIHHTETYSKDACVIFFCISKEFFADFFACLRTEDEVDNFNQFFKSFTTGMKEENMPKKIYWDFISKNTDNLNKFFNDVVAFKLEILNRDIGFRLILFGLLKRFLYTITNENYYVFNFNAINTPVKDTLAKDVKLYIETKRCRILRDDIENDMHYSADYLNRIFKAEYGVTMGQYQRTVCMNEAASLLLRTNKTIGMVSEQLGFSNRSRFYKLFNQKFGMTPQQYRDVNANK